MARAIVKRKLSWRPRRRGAVYCSSACGAGCTYAAYRAARRNGAALAKALGPGWKPRIWENLGWHWSARLAVMDCEVHGSRGPWLNSYWASLYFGKQFMGDGKTPRKAVAAAMDNARRHIEFTRRDFNKAIKIMGGDYGPAV